MAFSNLTINSVQERSMLGPGGVLGREIVITITTSQGSTGQLVIPLAQYNAMSDEELAQAVAVKAGQLDRLHLL